MSEIKRFYTKGYSKKYEDNFDAIFKPKRIKNERLLLEYRAMFCEVCGKKEGVCGHHVKSKGSGGDDEPSNLIPLCQEHHNQIHSRGLLFMSERYPQIKDALTERGWTLMGSKWVHPKV